MDKVKRGRQLLDGSVLSFGNYRALESLGHGSFGQVYRGEHRFLTRRVVAIKVMRDAPLHTEKEREAFLREAEILEQLKHRFILPIFDVGIQENEPYLVTEYAPNGSLKQFLDKLNGQALPLAEALNILSQVAEALQFAHEHKVIHRDLKPDNILFNAQNEALLADFNIATLLHTASFHQTRIIGTPLYMAPEQFRGEIAAESDQYAFACLAYELLTGHPPFSAPDFIALGFKHVHEAPQPPSQLNPNLPTHINAAILKALAKERTARYPSVRAFISALLKPLHSTSTFSSRHLPAIETPLPASPNASDLLVQARALQEQRRDLEALQIYNQSIQLDPNLADAYANKGYILNKLGRYQEALTALDQAIRLNPNHTKAYEAKGFALNALSRYKDAFHILDRAILLNPYNAETYNQKGFALNALGRYQEALLAYDQALKLDPTNAEAYNNKGFALNQLKRYEDALLAYDQAIRLNPNDDWAYDQKGFALDKLGRTKEARKAYDKARKLGWRE